MKIKTIKQDILQLDRKEYAIAHCVSGDYTLGAGLAKKINEQFNMSQKLCEKFSFQNGQRVALLVDGFFNLITKDCYKDKASYDGLKQALQDLKLNLYYMGYKKLAIPRLGCGKDKLEWNVVEAIIHDVFDDMDIQIFVCIL